MVDRYVEYGFDRLDEQIGSGVEGGVDPVLALDVRAVLRDVDPQVAGNGDDGDGLRRRDEAGDHRDVAPLATGVGFVAEGLDLRGIVDEGTGVAAHEQHIERLARRGGLLDQMLRVDLRDLVVTVAGIEEDAACASDRQEDDERQGVDDAATPTMLAALLLLACLAKVGLDIGPRLECRRTPLAVAAADPATNVFDDATSLFSGGSASSAAAGASVLSRGGSRRCIRCGRNGCYVVGCEGPNGCYVVICYVVIGGRLGGRFGCWRLSGRIVCGRFV